jgi:TolA-binding protein
MFQHTSRAKIVLICLICLYLSSCYRTPPDVIYQAAKEFQDQKKYNEAIQLYYQLYSKYPRHALSVKAFARIGKCYLEIGNDERALKIFQYYVLHYQSGDDMPYVLFDMGEIYQKKNSFFEALLCYQKIVDNYPKQDIAENALCSVGATYLNLHKYEIAIQTYLSFIAKYPKSEALPYAYNGLGYCYLHLNNNVMAKKYFNIVINHSPNIKPDIKSIASANYGMALIYIKQGKIKEAIALLKMIIKNYPSTESAQSAIGKLNELDKHEI